MFNKPKPEREENRHVKMTESTESESSEDPMKPYDFVVQLLQRVKHEGQGKNWRVDVSYEEEGEELPSLVFSHKSKDPFFKAYLDALKDGDVEITLIYVDSLDREIKRLTRFTKRELANLFTKFTLEQFEKALCDTNQGKGIVSRNLDYVSYDPHDIRVHFDTLPQADKEFAIVVAGESGSGKSVFSCLMSKLNSVSRRPDRW